MISKRRGLQYGILLGLSLAFLMGREVRLDGKGQGVTAPKVTAPIPAQAVSFLRLINTAEYQYRDRLRSFATLEQLSDSKTLQRLVQKERDDAAAHGRSSPPIGSNLDFSSTQPVPGYNLTSYTSADGSRYVYLLRNTGGAPCDPSFITDQDAVILQAKAIGCE